METFRLLRAIEAGTSTQGRSRFQAASIWVWILEVQLLPFNLLEKERLLSIDLSSQVVCLMFLLLAQQEQLNDEVPASCCLKSEVTSNSTKSMGSFEKNIGLEGSYLFLG
jgi:hypothetical protein